MTYVIYHSQTKEVVALCEAVCYARLFAECLDCVQTGSSVFGDYDWIPFNEIQDSLLAENVHAFTKRTLLS